MNDEDAEICVEVYSDIICPWCYVGKRRLERALTMIGEEPPVIWRPFQLNPAMPKNGMNRTAYLEAKFGSLSMFRHIEKQVLEAGKAEQISFAFDKITIAPNTFLAHRLIWYGRRNGKQDSTVETLFRYYFIEGRDIGQVQTLVHAAVEIGLDGGAAERFLTGEEGVQEVKAEESAGHRFGIGSVPYFLLNQTYAISGAQPADVLVSAIRKVRGHQVASVDGPKTGR